jgi:hypothetical protein
VAGCTLRDSVMSRRNKAPCNLFKWLIYAETLVDKWVVKLRYFDTLNLVNKIQPCASLWCRGWGDAPISKKNVETTRDPCSYVPWFFLKGPKNPRKSLWSFEFLMPCPAVIFHLLHRRHHSATKNRGEQPSSLDLECYMLIQILQSKGNFWRAERGPLPEAWAEWSFAVWCPWFCYRLYILLVSRQLRLIAS